MNCISRMRRSLLILPLAAAFLSSSSLFAAASFVSEDAERLTSIVLEEQRIDYFCSYPYFGGGLEYRMFSPVAYFQSETTAPAEGLRVRIENMTPGLADDPRPYSDREYDRGQVSEKILFGSDSKHRTRSFSLLTSGSELVFNQFRYEIYHAGDGEIIETGSLTAAASIDELPPVVRYNDSRYCWRQPDPLPF